MKKILIWAIISILALSMVTLGISCKEEAVEKEAAEETEEEAVEKEAAEETEEEAVEEEVVYEDVVIKVWKGIAIENEGEEYFPEWIHAFEDSHPGVTIEWTEIAWGDMSQLFATAFAAGDPPDIFYSFTGGYVDEVMQFCHDFKEIYTEEEYAAITEGISDAQLAAHIVNGKQVGIPFYGGPNLFIWNKGLFEEAGLDPEKGPETWDELLEMAKILTKDTDGDGKIDQWGFGQRSYESGAAKPEKWLWQAGFNLLNDDQTGIGYDDEGAIAAFEMIEKLWQTEKVAVPIGLYSGNTIIDAFYQQKFAMWYYNSNVLAEVGEDYDISLGCSVSPAGPGTNLAGGRGIPGGWGCWSIAEDTQYLELVKEFLYDFYTNPEILGLSASRVGAIPASTTAIFESEDPFVNYAAKEVGQYTVEYPYGLIINEVLVATNDAFQAVQLGTLNAREAWEQAVDEGKAAFE